MPELSGHFVAKAKNLLADRNHGVLLTAITLVTEMCQIDPGCLEEFRNVCIASLHLRAVIHASCRPYRYLSDI